MADLETSASTEKAKIDLLTISAVAIIVYFLCCFLHEAVGHGGTTALLAAKVTRITNAYVTHAGASDFQARLIAGAGISVNLLFGCLAIFTLRKWPSSTNSVMRYFLWLFGHMNLFTASGYMMTFALMRIGDLNIVVRGLPFETAIRIGILLAGLGITVWAFIHVGRTLVEFAGNGNDRMQRGVTLTLVPYLVGGSANVGASLLGVGNVPVAIVLVSAIGATFGGTFPFVCAPLMMPKPNGQISVLTPTRSMAWIMTGAGFLVLYVLLGRGVSFA